ncbi:ATP-binding cassette transporter [Xylogone sp. PMI_703]|nr:ATP-binding cassette transporter [Xylogone sp. PMI_703]
MSPPSTLVQAGNGRIESTRDTKVSTTPLSGDGAQKITKPESGSADEKSAIGESCPPESFLFQDKHKSDILSPRSEAHIKGLARTFSNLSRHSRSATRSANPILDNDDPALDPNSPKFDIEFWLKTYLSIISEDHERYPQRTAGVSFQGLTVYGFGQDTDYQKNVFNIFLAGFQKVQGLFRAKRRFSILKNFDGLIRPGEMCVVLGRPGSGVSTLLKTIAGQTYSLSVDENTAFNYQGIPRHLMRSHFRGEVVYQAESDVHFPHLTVGQTLLFASLARTPKNRLPGMSRQVYAQHFRDVVMAILGLSHTVDTKLGNDYIRGVSGGERKRVSIAEVMLCKSPLQCWDNSTRGLDSATALQFVKMLRLSTDLTNSTALVAIYQASQDAYEKFDKVTVLYEGRQIYFGKASSAKEYFTKMGYHCPDRQTTSDFLTSLTNPEERIVEPGFENAVPRTPDEFAEVWKHSDARKELLNDIANFENDFPLGGSQLDSFITSRKAQQPSLMRSTSPYTISVPMQIKLCMIRGFQRLYAESGFAIITIGGNFLMSLVLGSIFFNLPPDTSSFFGRGTLLFFAILFNALSSALEILPLYVQRPIVEKHKMYALYHPFAEAISSMICDLPTKVISTLAFNVPLYFMTNLRREVNSFFVFLLFAFSCTLAMSMIFRTIGQMSRTLSQAMTPLAIFLLGLVIYAGYVLPIPSMQGWLRWINRINPISYAFESIMVNEYHHRRFPCVQFIPAGPPYVNATGLERTCITPGALPGADFVDGDIYVGADYRYHYSHIWRNLGILFVFMVFFAAIALLLSEYVSFDRAKGEVLVFRRGHHKMTLERVTDEESQQIRPGIQQNSPGEDQMEESNSNARLQCQTSIFHWEDVCYNIWIKGKRRTILDHVDGWVKPGTLTALMGVTGAGKTTLLDVLASRVNVGVVTGDVMVDGHPRDSSFQRKTGYVQQQDIHLATSTVREALRFSASIRQPMSAPEEEKYKYVEEVIKLLQMENYAEAVVGIPGEGLNVEQRKRLTIGVELAAKPDLLLFLDEPTSGLDSQTAWSICALIRKLANNGQAILCTIHQPSAILFQQFDRLLLLAKGGKTVYFGEIGHDSKTIIHYFERNGARHIDPTENPAEWILEVIGAAPGVRIDQDWSQTWRDIGEYTRVKEQLASMRRELAAHASTNIDSTASQSYAAPFHFQLIKCTQRAFQQYWRTPSYIWAKLSLCGASSLFIGLSFLNSEVSLQGLQNQMFSIFMLMVIFAFLAYQAMPNFIAQRELYEARERPSKTYSWKAFMFANILVEIPWNALASILIFFPLYYPIGMYRNAIPTDTVTERGGLMFLLVLSFMLFASTFTSMVIAGVASAEIGAIIALILFALSLVFCGVLATPTVLPGFWIFMYRVSPFTYLVSALLSVGVANNEVKCAPLELLTLNPPSGQTCGQYLNPFAEVAGGVVYNPSAAERCQYCSMASTNTFLASVFSFYDQRWRNFGLMWVYINFNAFAAVMIYWLARVPRKSALSVIREALG